MKWTFMTVFPYPKRMAGPQRSIATLNLDSALRSRLYNAGYRTTADLGDITAQALAQGTVDVIGGSSCLARSEDLL